MDPALLKQRADFKARAMKLPTVEKRKAPVDDSALKQNMKKFKATKPKATPATSTPAYDYKTMSAPSNVKFNVLSKIVRYMKERHQKGETHPLSLDDVLEETRQEDIAQKTKRWLAQEALSNNPKIEVTNDDMYKFRPKYDVRTRKAMLRLLEDHDMKGLGGIMMDDLEESVPRFQKALKQLDDRIIKIQRPIDKKCVLYYNDKSSQYEVDEDIQKLWRGVAVEGVDDAKIEEYLKKHGIATMQDLPKTNHIPKRKPKGGRRKKTTFKTHNEHMGTVLQDYSEVKK